MFKDERRDWILQHLTANGSVRVTEIARTLNVDPVTIRRDLAALEKAGHLHRVHGGAVPSSGQTTERQTTDPQLTLKRRIAEAAAQFIADGSVVFLGPGPLTQEVVPFLNDHTHLTIITNALGVAWSAAQQRRHTLHIIGGQVTNTANFGIYGGSEALRHIRADLVILEASGLDAERGLTHDHRDYATMARALFALGAQTTVLIAPERLGRTGVISIVPASEVDAVITGREAPTPALWDLSEVGVRVILT